MQVDIGVNVAQLIDSNYHGITYGILHMAAQSLPIERPQTVTFVKILLVVSPTGNRTPVSRVTGGDTYHYTIEDHMLLS